MSSKPNASSSPEASSDRVARTLYQALVTELTQQFAKRYDAGIVLQCPELRRIEEPPEDVSLMVVRLYSRGLTTMQARLLVTCMENSGYDVLCTVEDGRTHRFSYHLPGHEMPSPRQLVPLAQDLATFLRRELENRLGRLLLQSPVRPPRQERDSLFP
ncbi:MAG TPA: hypothetical protein VJ884_00975 [Salinibacter sp.]|nr:hypothetical protein [Salinibacter sp.]